LPLADAAAAIVALVGLRAGVPEAVDATEADFSAEVLA